MSDISADKREIDFQPTAPSKLLVAQLRLAAWACLPVMTNDDLIQWEIE